MQRHELYAFAKTGGPVSHNNSVEAASRITLESLVDLQRSIREGRDRLCIIEPIPPPKG